MKKTVFRLFLIALPLQFFAQRDVIKVSDSKVSAGDLSLKNDVKKL